ncbi:MAG: uroporphyrinogen decarboxylase [Thermaerobacter sp.]|nr:uroporphyrinogen decarboxylase [Thermaerobacter sp.]
MAESRFIRACQGQPVDAVPVWFMRQAGRYQASYRELRRRYSLLQIAVDPKLCAEVTCRPVEDLGVDAAILFSDIMVPLAPMGISFEIRENVGPIVERPIRSREAVEGLRTVDPDTSLDFALEAITRCVDRLGSTPLIGFAGGPFTLASYCVEGGPSRQYLASKRLMWTEPDVFGLLMERLADTVARYLTAQIRAGAAAVQVFDSWIGALSEADYRTSVLPQVRRIFDAVRPWGVPMIYFGVNTEHLLAAMAETGATVIGIDWRIPPREARARLGVSLALQGNLDPAAILAGWNPTKRLAREILAGMADQPGFVFNLGHGVLKESDPAILRRLVEFVHAYPGEADGDDA